MRTLRALSLLLAAALAVPAAATAATAATPTEAPVVTAPAGPLSGVANLVASSAGPDVRFELDGVVLGTAAVAEGTATYALDTYGRAPGEHALTARACDAGDCGPASAPVAVTIDNAAPALTAPAPAAVIGGATTLTATAPGGGVRFLLDGAPVGDDLEAPYAVSFDPFTTTQGEHALTARSCDAAGLCDGATSEPVSVTVDLRPALTGPAAGAAVAGDVPLAATSQGPQVRFYVDGAEVTGLLAPVAGEVAGTWSSYGFSNGDHEIAARACHPTHGCAAPSAARTVTVDNAVPALTSPVAGTQIATPVTLTASAPGGRVRFELDGNPVAAPVGSPYEVVLDPSNYAAGGHTLVVRACRATGDVCDGPASDPVPVTTSPRPDVEAPAGGSTVSGVVPLRAVSPAPAVRFWVDGVPFGNPVPTVDGVATKDWTTFGLPNGAHTVGATACDASQCAASPQGVPVELLNAAPVVTSPAPNALVGSGTTVTATAPAGSGVRFEIDGVAIGDDATAPYSVNWTAAGSDLPQGGHVFTARSCDAAFTRCGGPVSAGVPWVLGTLKPRIDAIAPRAISPNGDRFQDFLTVTFTIDAPSGAAFRVRNAAGTQVLHSRGLGQLPAGRRTLTWNGTTNTGARVPAGTYTLWIETSKPANGGMLYGAAAVQGIVVDVAAPPIGKFVGSGTFYPAPDNYLDTFSPYLTIGERANVQLRVYDALGRVVHGAGRWADPGVVRVTWNGRLASGAMAPAGNYTYQWTAMDAAANRAVSPRFPFTLSPKRLVARLGNRTVTPYESVIGVFEGGCAEAVTPAVPGWTGSIGYYSDCFWDGSSDDDLVATRHRFTLPPAIRYGNVQIKATGQALSTDGDKASVWYDANTDAGVVLQPAYGTYPLAPVPASLFDASRSIVWVAGTRDFNWYGIRSFQVTWVYYVLA